MEDYSVPKRMKKLGDLFEKYRSRFKAPQASVEKECAQVIIELTGFDIDVDKLTYTVATRTIFIQVPSLLKSELKFHYTAILTALQGRLGRDVAPKTII